MRLRPLSVGSPGTLRLRVSESSSLSAWSFPFRGLSPFLAFVPLLEALSESLTHSIPRSFLMVALSASAVGFADALWLCPERALRRFFASVSLFDPVALSPLLHRVFTDGFRHWCAFRFCGGTSPHAFGPVGALGELRWLHLYRLTPDLVGLRQFAVCLWSSGRCFMFYCATFRPYSWRSFGQFHCLLRVPCASFPCGDVPWTLARRVSSWTYCPPPRSSRALLFALTYIHGGRVLMHPAIDIVWRWPCLPRLRWL